MWPYQYDEYYSNVEDDFFINFLDHEEEESYARHLRGRIAR